MRTLIAVAAALVAAAAAAAAEPAAPLAARVDERVELVSIVFRLAGNSEYNMSQLPGYSADIDAYFGPFKNHPTVALARQLARKRGVAFDAVMSMAIHLSPPPSLRPLVPFGGPVPDERWGKDGVEFAASLARFHRDTHFDKFFAAHHALYEAAEESFVAIARDIDFDWFAKFWGQPRNGAFHVLLGLNNGGGNYGPHLVHPDGSEERFAIIGCWTKDGQGRPLYTRDGDYLPTVIHEFSHSFVNPIVAAHWPEFRGTDAVYRRVAARMKSQAYATPQDLVDESLVRAGVISYSEAHGAAANELERQIRVEQTNGFLWMDELVALLRTYRDDRSRQPRFESFLPRVIAFFRELGPRMDVLLARIKQVHVTKMEPFANHATAVDPSTTELVITFDRPLDAKRGYSINYGDGGKAHFAIVGKPEFERGGKAIRLHVALAPHEHYEFVLTPLAFASAEGFPLETYAVDFATK